MLFLVLSYHLKTCRSPRPVSDKGQLCQIMKKGEIMYYANTKDPDQSAHLQNFIRTPAGYKAHAEIIHTCTMAFGQCSTDKYNPYN